MIIVNTVTKRSINEWFDFVEQHPTKGRNPNGSEVRWLKMPRIETAYNVA